MSKENDKRSKPAPPRESDSARQARLRSQLGLDVEFCAKQRRYLDRAQRTHKQQRQGR